ncbi:hypothetical protein MA16_Dca018370 [Dendrobium catenatum]|uniref:Uncharacterized protein n=1 Tax=Dendrobium catenatum TaxID=906689 RepID=A0A2I0XAU0_9ASPA|nr:hypothetical protein MA16_Dca018370 [Dendrobium catenatum]
MARLCIIFHLQKVHPYEKELPFVGDQKHLALAHLFDKPCFLGLLALQFNVDSASAFSLDPTQLPPSKCVRCQHHAHSRNHASAFDCLLLERTCVTDPDPLLSFCG